MNFTTDKNGFIRLDADEFFKSRVERIEKMLGINGTMPNWYPVETNPDYEKYPYKNFKGKYVDAYTACPAEVFCYRYFKKWIASIKESNKNWIRFSYFGNYNEKQKRFCKTLYVYNIDWVNHPYSQIIKIIGITVDGQLDTLEIRIDSLRHLAIKICSEAESSMLNKMLFVYKPEPNIPLFRIYNKYYYNNYDKYRDDCKTYNITPLSKTLIHCSNKDIVINAKTGKFASENDDTYIVNKLPEN